MLANGRAVTVRGPRRIRILHLNISAGPSLCRGCLVHFGGRCIRLPLLPTQRVVRSLILLSSLQAFELA